MGNEYSQNLYFENQIRHDLERLKSITNTSGQYQEFDYIDPNLSYMHVGELTANGKTMSDEYKTMGREPYSSVILERSTIKDSKFGNTKDITYFTDTNQIFCMNIMRSLVKVNGQ